MFKVGAYRKRHKRMERVNLLVSAIAVDDGLFELLWVSEREAVETFAFLKMTFTFKHQLRSLEATPIVIIEYYNIGAVRWLRQHMRVGQ